MRETGKSWAVRVTLSIVVMAAAGCGSEPSAQVSVTESARSTAPPPRIPAARLAEIGMEEVWYSDVNVGRGIHRAYLLDEGLFIVTTPSGRTPQRVLKRVDRATGNDIWHLDVEGDIELRPATYAYPTGVAAPPEVLFSVLDTIYCVDLRYGDELWKRTMKFPVSTPLAAGETHIFAGSANKRVYAVRKKWTVHDWTHRTAGEVSVAPLLAGDRVLFASHDGSVYGLDANQGWVYPDSWERKTGARITAEMAEYAGWVFVGSTDYKLYCLEALDGTVAWSFVAQAPIIDAPVILKHAANREYVYCIGATGSRANPERTLFAIPIPKGGTVTAGNAIWQVEGIRKVITMGTDTLYVIKEGGPEGERLIAGLDVATGREKFTLSAEGFHFVPTNHADAGRNKAERGRIYLISTSGAVQAIGEKL